MCMRQWLGGLRLLPKVVQAYRHSLFKCLCNLRVHNSYIDTACSKPRLYNERDVGGSLKSDRLIQIEQRIL